MNPRTRASRRRSEEAGLFLVLVALPLIFSPSSAAPYVDIKLVTVLGGVLLLALGRAPVDRRMALLAGAWISLVATATLIGADPWWSLLGAEDQGVGLLAIGASAILLVIGTGIDDHIVERSPSWLFGAGVAVSAIAILGRFASISTSGWELDRLGATLGHRVFVGAFVAAAVVAGTALRSSVRFYIGLVILASGLAVSAVRSAWIGTALGLIAVALFRRDRRDAALRVFVPVALVLTGWTLANGALPAREQGIAFSAAPRFTEVREGSARERLAVWRVFTRASSENVFFGSGPATSWGVFLRNAKPEEIKLATRGYGDAHNIFLEVRTTTGVPSTLLLVAVVILVSSRARRAPSNRAWAAGCTLVLFVVSLFQPLNVVITPVMFLLAGIAAAKDTDDEGRVFVFSRWVSVAIVVGLLLACNRFVAGSFERSGRHYSWESALRKALRIEPWRIGAAELLARERAIDYRSGDPTARREALLIANQTVLRHGWNPGVRLEAANVAAVVDEDGLAMQFVREQLALFPNDPVAIAGLTDFKNRRPLAAK